MQLYLREAQMTEMDFLNRLRLSLNHMSDFQCQNNDLCGYCKLDIFTGIALNVKHMYKSYLDLRFPK